MIVRIYDGVLHLRRVLERDRSGTPLRTIYNNTQHSRDIEVYVFDGRNNNAARRALYPGYKMKRKPMADDISAYLNLWKQLVKLSRATTVELEGYEADDVIAHLAARYSRVGVPVEIVTSDGDLRQLETLPGVRVLSESLRQIPPHLIRLYKATVGDPSDNIPGIKGFGKGAWEEADHDALHDWFVYGGAPPADLKPGVKAAMAANRDEYLVYWNIVAPLPLADDTVTAAMVAGQPNPEAVHKILKELLQ